MQASTRAAEPSPARWRDHPATAPASLLPPAVVGAAVLLVGGTAGLFVTAHRAHALSRWLSRRPHRSRAIALFARLSDRICLPAPPDRHGSATVRGHASSDSDKRPGRWTPLAHVSASSGRGRFCVWRARRPLLRRARRVRAGASGPMSGIAGSAGQREADPGERPVGALLGRFRPPTAGPKLGVSPAHLRSSRSRWRASSCHMYGCMVLTSCRGRPIPASALARTTSGSRGSGGVPHSGCARVEPSVSGYGFVSLSSPRPCPGPAAGGARPRGGARPCLRTVLEDGMVRHRRGASPEGAHAGGIFRSPLPGTTVPLGRPGVRRCRPGAGCGALVRGSGRAGGRG